MRKIFKFSSYSLLYLVVSVASAYGVITFSMNNNSGNSNLGSGGGGEIVIADEINAIVNNLTSANALDIVLQADIESGESDITVGLDGQIDLSGGIDNLMAEVNLNLGFVKINLISQLHIRIMSSTSNSWVASLCSQPTTLWTQLNKLPPLSVWKCLISAQCSAGLT